MNYYKILLSILLFITASVPYILLKKQHKMRHGSLALNNQVDIFSPAVAFPMAYAFIYSIGSFDLVRNSLPIPLTQYTYYFLGLGAYFSGLWISKIYNPSEGMIIHLGNDKKEFPLLLIGFILMLFFSGLVFYKAGIPLISADVETSRTLMVKKAGGWLYYMYKTLPLFTALLIIYKWKYCYDIKKIMLRNYLVVVGLIFVILGAYRGPLVTVFLLLLITYHYLKKPFSYYSLSIIGVLSFSLFSLLGILRATSGAYYHGAWWYKLLVEISNPANALSIITNKIPAEFPFFHGRLILNAFYSLLPGEQLAYGIVLKNMFNMYFTGGGFTPSLLGGLYLDFGVAGIIIFMCSCGIVLHCFYKKMLADFTPYNIVTYAFILQYFIICIRGGFLQEILPLWFLLILFFLRILTEKRPFYLLT